MLLLPLMLLLLLLLLLLPLQLLLWNKVPCFARNPLSPEEIPPEVQLPSLEM